MVFAARRKPLFELLYRGNLNTVTSHTIFMYDAADVQGDVIFWSIYTEIYTQKFLGHWIGRWCVA